ncbi:hypothetical protein [Micromonospora luteifusca]|uniref:hypothetical protein n=1 Tax=Micromonospora luteifusca TaxID=709860 RepID=UPI0033A3098E
MQEGIDARKMVSACPFERESRVDGGQFLDVPAGTAGQVEPGYSIRSGGSVSKPRSSTWASPLSGVGINAALCMLQASDQFTIKTHTATLPVKASSMCPHRLRRKALWAPDLLKRQKSRSDSG